MSDHDTPEAREAAWNNEWALQISLLSKKRRDDIFLAGPMSIYSDDLGELVEKILCARGEL